MSRFNSWAASFLTIVIMTVGTAQGGLTEVVINEYSYDDSGTDDREFVELYNAGQGLVDIGGWVLASNDPSGGNMRYTIPTGTNLAPGDYWVMGAETVPNVDQVVGTTDIWENGEDSLELRGPNNILYDAVVYESNKSIGWEPDDVTPEIGGGWWGNFTSIDGTFQSVGRWRDGLDTNFNGRDFGLLPRTPGTSNNLPLNRNYQPPNVDQLVGPVPGYQASFVLPMVINPAEQDANNPNPIDPSPQGGNAIVAWDPAGGGNMVASTELVAGSPGSYKLVAYLDTKRSGDEGRESTTYGIGTTGTFYNQPDPSGSSRGEGITENGNTGVGWLFEKDHNLGFVNLHLIDFGPGGDSSPGVSTPQDWQIITTIDLVNEPSSWQALSIAIDEAGNVTAEYGDQAFNFKTDTTVKGTFYVGYRESLEGTPAFLRPPTFDGIPEPSTFALAGLGILGLFALVGRQQPTRGRGANAT